MLCDGREPRTSPRRWRGWRRPRDPRPTGDGWLSPRRLARRSQAQRGGGMPRLHLQRRMASWLGILALVGAALGPGAAGVGAAPQYQTGMDQSNPGIIVAIDEPTNRSGTTASRVLVRGWALNPASQRGTGVSRVDLYLDGGPDQGGMYLGRAAYGSARPDVVDSMDGSQ